MPAQSEALLAYHVSRHPEAIAYLVSIATLGNVLGALTNWLLGRFVNSFSGRTWFPVDQQKLLRGEGHYRKYGRYSLLLSWVPFIGDPITIIAGVLREPLWSFLILVTIAKFARYVAIALLVESVI